MSKVNVIDGKLVSMGDEDVHVRVRFQDKNRQMVDCLLAPTSPLLSQLNVRQRYIVSVEEVPDSPGGNTP